MCQSLECVDGFLDMPFNKRPAEEAVGSPLLTLYHLYNEAPIFLRTGRKKERKDKRITKQIKTKSQLKKRKRVERVSFPRTPPRPLRKPQRRTRRSVSPKSPAKPTAGRRRSPTMPEGEQLAEPPRSTGPTHMTNLKNMCICVLFLYII